MELTILGSGTCRPSPSRGCAGHLVRVAGENLLMDAGPGVFRQLAKMEVDLANINDVLITHFHIDHMNDLSAILFTMKNCLPTRRGDITIHGPKGFAKKFAALSSAFGRLIKSDDYKTTVREHGEDDFAIGSIRVRTLPMAHGEPCIGYRIDDGRGKSLAYSGDTAPCDNIATLANNSEALLMESTTPDDAPKKGHTTTSQAAEIAKNARVKTLLLTHISPENDTTDLGQKAGKIFDGTVIVARDGMTITI